MGFYFCNWSTVTYVEIVEDIFVYLTFGIRATSFLDAVNNDLILNRKYHCIITCRVFIALNFYEVIYHWHRRIIIQNTMMNSTFQSFLRQYDKSLPPSVSCFLQFITFQSQKSLIRVLFLLHDYFGSQANILRQILRNVDLIL